MPIAEGVVLSHTRNGQQRRGFCTNILIHPGTPEARQIRPRLPYNKPLFINSFNCLPAEMDEYWQPGRVVRIRYDEMPARFRRATHPEDVLYIPNYEVAADPEQMHTTSQLIELVDAFTFDNVYEAFPTIEAGGYGSGRDKYSTPPDEPLERSIAYVCGHEFMIGTDNSGKHYAQFRDLYGHTIRAALKDEYLLATYPGHPYEPEPLYDPVIVRCALSDAFSANGHPPRCWLMVSWASVKHIEFENAF